MDGGGAVRIDIGPPPPTGDSLDAALEEFTNEVRLQNEQAANELIDKLKDEIRRGKFE